MWNIAVIMGSQSYQLSFGVTVLLLFIGVLVTVILIATALKAMGTIATFIKQVFSKSTRSKEESEFEEEPLTRRRKRLQDDEEDSTLVCEE